MRQDRRDQLTVAAFAFGCAGFAALLWSLTGIGPAPPRKAQTAAPPPPPLGCPVPCEDLPADKPVLLLLHGGPDGVSSASMIAGPRDRAYILDNQGRRVWLFVVVQHDRPTVMLKAQRPHLRQRLAAPAEGPRRRLAAHPGTG